MRSLRRALRAFTVTRMLRTKFRTTFITVTACIALAVGVFALALPAQLLAAKGVAPSVAAMVWVREVGVLIIALGVMSLFFRTEPDSRALRAFSIGNAIVHAGLLPIEIAAFANGTITRFDGIAPNSVLHLLVAAGFSYLAITSGPPRS